MMPDSKTKLYGVTLLVLLIIGLFSVNQVFSLLQVPDSELSTRTLIAYSQELSYDYSVTLLPNAMYNASILRRGEGILYQSIIGIVSLTTEHFLTSNKPLNEVHITNKITIKLEAPGKWNKTLTESEIERYFQLSPGLNFNIAYNSTLLSELFDTIDKETRTRSTTHNIVISPTYTAKAVNNETNINQDFTPALTISYITDSGKGSYIDFNGLYQEKDEKVTQTTSITPPFEQNWVRIQRWSYFIIGSTSGFAFLGTSFLFARNLPMTKQEESDRIRKKYQDLLSPLSD